MTSVTSPMRPQGDDRAAGTRRREPRDALPPGTVLGGGYRVERTLGQGGFGIVYLATDLALERTMAIKEYLPVQLAGRGQGTAIGLREAGHKDAFVRGLQSFLREARLLAQFDHPALVRVYRFWEENHTAYMAMPYCEGPTLHAARQTMLRPPDEHWLRERLLLPLLGALDTLHAGQCLHRDVAPGNILLKSDGQPVLLDFGSARRVVSDMTQPLTAIINPSYAAIEQYAESTTLPQGPWTDLYGLAAVAYFALSGRAPVPATVRAVNEAALMPFAELAQLTERSFPGLHYSAPFVAALDAALAVRPGDRPQSVKAMREALTRPHVQPDVTVEGPPLQAVPIKAVDGAGQEAPASASAASEGAEPEDKAVRAAIDAALADIGDWPPITRRDKARVEPTWMPDLSPRPSEREAAADRAAMAAKAPPLRVVPAAETPQQPADKHAEAPAQDSSASPPAAKGETLPAGAWLATAPAVTSMRVPTPATALPVQAAARAQSSTLPPAESAPETVTQPSVQSPSQWSAPSKPAAAEPARAEATPAAKPPATESAAPPSFAPLGLATDPSAGTGDEPPLEPPLAFDGPQGDMHGSAGARSVPPRRRSALPWALAAVMVAAVGAGAWYVQSAPGSFALLTGGSAATPSPIEARPTPMPTTGRAALPAPAPAVTARAATPAPSPAASSLPGQAATPPLAAAAPASSPAVVMAVPSPAPTPAPVPSDVLPPRPADTQATAGSTTVAGDNDTASPGGTSSSGTSSSRNNRDGADNGNGAPDSRVPPPSRRNAATAATKPPVRTAAAKPAPEATPRAACGSRTNFSLYYCMRTQCQQARFSNHPQCKRLRESDEVPS